MPNTTDAVNENRVSSYLRYLRDVTRKVLIRSGIKNVLKGTKANPTLYFNYSEHSEFHLKSYLKQARIRLQRDTSKQLFMGFGLVVGGSRGSGGGGGSAKVAAPIFYLPILLDGEASVDELKLDWDAVQLNLELLADFVGRENNEVENEGNSHADALFADPVGRDVQQLLAEADDALESKCKDMNWRGKLLSNASECGKCLESFFRTELYQRINDIRHKIHVVSADGADKFNVRFDYKPGDRNLERKLKDLYGSGKVYFFPQAFIFSSTVPAEISTYSAIKELINECESHGIQNELLRKMVGGLVSNKKIELRVGLEKREKIEEAIRKVPLPLSAEQKEAVIHAWEQEVSYIEGPPGTGKSHTITALMLSALIMGKSVLLVSHKRDAVRVVRMMVQKYLGSHRVIYAGDDPEGRREMQEYLTGVANLIARPDYIARQRAVKDNVTANLDNLTSKLRILDIQESQIAGHVGKERVFAEEHTEFVRSRGRLTGDIPPGYDFSETRHIKDPAKMERLLQKMEALYSEVYVERGYKLTHAEKISLRKVLLMLRDDFNIDAERLKEEHEERSVLLARKTLELVTQWQSANKQGAKIAPGALRVARERSEHMAHDLQRFQQKHLEAVVDDHVLRHSKYVEEDLKPLAKLWYWRNPDRIREIMDGLDYEGLVEAFPLWAGEMRHLGGYLPFEAGMFDLVIVDEASQVNIAEILPALYRGKQFCVVGDKKQLGLNSAGLFSVNRTFEQLIWNRYCGQDTFVAALEKKMILSKDSILDFITEANGFSMKSTLLTEHFRSMPALAAFTSRKYYEDRLRLMRETPQYVRLRCFSAIATGGRRGRRDEDGVLLGQKVVEEEVAKVLEILVQLIRERAWLKLEHLKEHGFTEEKPPSIGVISFTTDQRNYLKERIEDEDFFDPTERGMHELFIGTPEEYQGSERNIIILTLAHDGEAAYARGHYEDSRRLNVATSRAINYTYFVYGGLPSNAIAFKGYLRHFGVEIATTPVEPEEPEESGTLTIRNYRWDFNRCRYSDSAIESEFERKVAEYLEEYRDDRSDYGVELYNQVGAGTSINSCGQKRLDFVLYSKQTLRCVAVEVDGKHHFEQSSGKQYGEAHLERVEILKRAGWQIVHIPYYEWYQSGWLCNQADSLKFQRSWKRTKEQLDVGLGID
jgi:hypothetical protein